MRETYSDIQSRKDRLRNKTKDECNHDKKEHWCGNCVNTGIPVDLRSEGLGRGHIISNINPSHLT